MWHKTLYDSIYRIGTENRWRFNLQFGALILLCALQVVKIPISVIIDELIALLESSGLDSAQSASLPSQKADFFSEAELSF